MSLAASLAASLAPPVAAPAARYELRFQSLFHTGRALSFPCDAQGEPLWDVLSERAREALADAEAGVGVEFATPAVMLSDLH